MFKSKIFKLAYAISVAEGWYARGEKAQYQLGTASYINHNPGNIRHSTFEIGNTGQYSVFENDMVGYYAIVHQLYLYASGHSNFVPPVATVQDAISRYNSLPVGSTEFNTYMGILTQISGVQATDTIASILNN